MTSRPGHLAPRLPVSRRGALSALGLGGGMVLGAGAFPVLAQLPSQAPAIGLPEREARLAKARALMRAQDIDAIVIEPGASLVYFTGVEWGRSERVTAAVITASGDIGFVTPAFEAPRLQERLKVPAAIRTWEEHESPFACIAGLLRDRQAQGTVGFEETVRQFVSDGLIQALPSVRAVSAAGVVRGCRMIKSPAEIALMQTATDITVSAIASAARRIVPGMTGDDIAALVDKATIAQGGVPEFSLVLIGEASAYPHGTRTIQRVGKGSVILMDCGCAVEGYQSDVSRSFAFGAASDQQRRVYDHVREGQRIVLAAARIGTPAGALDDAVRRHYESLGYGPGYKLPGLSHRTGHGIGLEGHEPVHLVHGEQTPLQPGMCFSNEPGIYLPGAFGIRIEDCFHMTGAGPVSFSRPPEELVVLG